jgi:hypothetical protein
MSFFRNHALLILLAAGLALRLMIAPLGAHPGDFATLSRWAEMIQHSGLLSIYSLSDANYPPLALALIGVIRWLYGMLWAGTATGPSWLVIAKLPPILSDIGIGWVIAKRGVKHLWILAALVAFNPAMIYLSAWWGQYESIYMLGVLAACLAGIDSKWLNAGLWLGAALMIKVQAVVVMPVIVILSLRVQDQTATLARVGKLSAGAAAIPTLALSPFVIMGQGELVWLRAIALISSPSWLTVNGLNFWYLATGGAGNWAYNAPMPYTDADPFLGGIAARQIGLGLLGVWSIAVLVILWHSSRTIPHLALLAAALLYLGTFLWPTQAHERYAFGAIVLLCVWALLFGAEGMSALRGAAFLTGLHFMNLAWAAPFADGLNGWFSANEAVGMVISALMIGCAGWLLWRFFRALPMPI